MAYSESSPVSRNGDYFDLTFRLNTYRKWKVKYRYSIREMAKYFTSDYDSDLAKYLSKILRYSIAYFG